MRLAGHRGSSHVNAEIMAEAGFDLMIIDMEHSQLSLQDTVHIIQTTKERLRPVCQDAVERYGFGSSRLWIQAHTAFMYLMFPQEKRLEYAVKCCKYAPQGCPVESQATERATNFSLSKADYYARANEDVIVMIAIETPEGVGNIRRLHL